MKIYANQAEAPYISAQEKPLRLQQAEDMHENTSRRNSRISAKRFVICCVGLSLFQWTNSCMTAIIWTGAADAAPSPLGTHARAHFAFMENDSIVITGGRYGFGERPASDCKSAVNAESGQAVQSMDKLMSLKADTYYCYHGGIYRQKRSGAV